MPIKLGFQSGGLIRLKKPSISYIAANFLSFFGASLCVLFLLASSSQADSRAYKTQISALAERIHATQKTIQAKESERSSLRRLLENYDKQIAAIRNQRSALKKKAARLLQSKESSRTQSISIQLKVDQRDEALARQLRAMYKAGRNPHLKTLLTLDDPSAGSRMLRYYQKVTLHRLKDIQITRQSLGEAMDVVTLTDDQENQIENERQALTLRESELAKLSDKRSRLLSKIEDTLSLEQKRLSSLETDRNKLQALMQELLQQKSSVAKATAGVGGELPWPLVGKLSARFGQSKSQGSAEWAGILIRANKGSPVVAVHEGQVVYAEWLRGYGLLIIIDHGNNTMSLYGNNNELMYNVGETVLPGDVIASVGDSSSINQTGLYFELRQDGSAVDPLKLLTNKMTTANR